MRKLASALLVLTFTLGWFTAQTAGAAVTIQPAGKTAPPGVQIAQTLSMVTGVAISPLLGVSAIGWYQWQNASTPEEKAKLPWFANPLFWGPGLLLVLACFLKDAAGVVASTRAPSRAREGTRRRCGRARRRHPRARARARSR